MPAMTLRKRDALAWIAQFETTTINLSKMGLLS